MATTPRTTAPTGDPDLVDEAAVSDLDDTDGVDPWAGFTEIDRERGYRILTPEEGRAAFDRAARKWMGISGEEFIRRWDAGEYKEIADKDGYRHIMQLAGLIGFARQDD